MILGAGRAIGERVHTNAELAAATGKSVEWILEKSGITQRHYTSGPISALALQAAQEALGRAQVPAASIGMVVCCTATNDLRFPPLALKIHKELGCQGGLAYDLQANCSGFVTALVAVSDRMAADPDLEYALIVGAEKLSPLVDPKDIETALFCSDGAGAVVVGRGGLRSAAFDTHTENFESVKATDTMTMHGMATWVQAVTHLPALVRRAVEDSGWELDDVDLVLFHQASLRLLEFLMARLRLPFRKTFTNVQSIGNCGAGSIPICIADAIDEGTFHGKIVLAGIGAGFGFSAACLVQP